MFIHAQTNIELSTIDNAGTLEPYRAVATGQTQSFYRRYFSRAVLVELRSRHLELTYEARQRSFYLRYYTGVVLPELLDSLVVARLGREPARLHSVGDVDWNYYLEVILPVISDSGGSGQHVDEPVEVTSPALAHWNSLERAERGDTWADIQRSRGAYNWEAELLEEYPDFWESWSP